MAVTFPRELPVVKWGSAKLHLENPVAAARAVSAPVTFTQRGDPYWVASLRTAWLSRGEAQEVEAWWLSLREGLRNCLFRHPHIAAPIAHKPSDAAALDTGVITAVPQRDTLSVGSLSAGLTLRPGDAIGIENAGKFAFARVADVSGSGASRTLTVEPPPLASVAVVGALVRFIRPAILMRPVPQSFQTESSGTRLQVSFELMEAP